MNSGSEGKGRIGVTTKGRGSDYCTDSDPCCEHGSPEQTCLHHHVSGKRVPVHSVHNDCLIYSTHTPPFSQHLTWLLSLLYTLVSPPLSIILSLSLPQTMISAFSPSLRTHKYHFSWPHLVPRNLLLTAVPTWCIQVLRAALDLKHTQKQVNLEEEQVLLMSVS